MQKRRYTKRETVTLPLLVPGQSDAQANCPPARDDLLLTRKGFQSVRLLRQDEDLRRELKTLSVGEARTFSAIVAFKKGLEKRDPLAIEKASRLLVPALVDVSGDVPPDALPHFNAGFAYALARLSLEYPAAALREVAMVLTQVLQNKAEFVLWAHGGRLVPALFCRDTAAVLFAREAFALQRALTATRACLHCGELFAPKRSNNTMYCSEDCGNAHRQDRFRRAHSRKPKSRRSHRRASG